MECDNRALQSTWCPYLQNISRALQAANKEVAENTLLWIYSLQLVLFYSRLSHPLR